MKYRILTALAVAALLSFAACKSVTDHVGGVTAGVDYNTTNGAVGGTIGITFKDAAGVTKSVTVPRRVGSSRGYDLGGNFVTLATLKGYAIAAYQHGQDSRSVANTYRLDEFDRQTIEIVITALAKAGAVSFN